MFRLMTLAVCVAVAVAQDGEWEKPGFCNTNDCPVYSVLASEPGYELRRYQAAKWVSTVVTASNAAEADEQLSIAFNRLFNYIGGQNANSQTIPMTAPVAIKVVPASGPNGETVFTESFYLPYNLQEEAPEPTNPDVFLSDAPQMDIYTRSFTDYATIQDHIDNVVGMAEAIGDSSMYEQEYFYMSGYDSPFKWWERHNESWLVAKSAEDKH